MMSDNEEEYNDAMDYIVTDEFGNRRLKQDKPQRPQNQQRHEDPNPLEWVKYAVYIWALRLSLSTLGSLLPVLMGFLSVFTLSAFSSPNSPSFMHNVTILDWQTVQQPGELAIALRSSLLPIKLINIPTISSSTSKIILRGLYLSHALRLKVQYNNSRYVYFDETRLWSGLFSGLRTYSYQSLSSYISSSPSLDTCTSSSDHQGTCTDDSSYKMNHPNYEYIDFMKDEKRQSKHDNDANSAIERNDRPSGNNMHIYSSFPDLLPYLEVFAPHLVGALGTAPSARINSAQLWLSSLDVQAGFHYDIQDNILYQLSGQKAVYIMVHPNRSIIQTYPSFHPFYRQGFMLSKDSGLSHVYGQSMPGEVGSVLEVTLHKGEAIYIPKGYLHSVATTSSDSLSVNTWLHSQAYAEWTSKLDSIALPFQHVGSRAGRLARVGAIAREVSRLLYGHDFAVGGDVSDIPHGLARELQARMKGPVIEYEMTYEDSKSKQTGNSKENSQFKDLICLDQENINAELDSAVKRAASTLAHTAVHFLPSLSPDIVRNSLVDFFEASCLAAIRYEDEEDDGYGDDVVSDAKEGDVDAMISALTPVHFEAMFESCFFLHNSQL